MNFTVIKQMFHILIALVEVNCHFLMLTFPVNTAW